MLQSLRQVIPSIDAGILLIVLRSVCAGDSLDGLIKVRVTKIPIASSPHVSVPSLDGITAGNERDRVASRVNARFGGNGWLNNLMLSGTDFAVGPASKEVTSVNHD